jgi:hypothetical protein
MLGLLGEEATQIGRTNIDQRRDAVVSQVFDAGAGVARIRFARRVSQPALDTAVDQEVSQGIEHRSSVPATQHSLSNSVGGTG